MHTLIDDGFSNINLPGSSWNAYQEAVVFSSDRGFHDEIFMIDDAGSTGDQFSITQDDSKQFYESSFSPDGEWVVFESHSVIYDESGEIVDYK